jgi:hypothetical protein
VIGALSLLTIGCGLKDLLNGPSGEDRFSWTVDGQPIEASSNGRGASRSGGGIVVTGANCGSGAKLTLSMFSNLVAGTFPVGSEYTVTWTPDTRTGESANTWWEANTTRGSGSLTISSNTSDRIAGHFSFVLGPGAGSNALGPRSLQGDFDLDFKGNFSC